MNILISIFSIVFLLSSSLTLFPLTHSSPFFCFLGSIFNQNFLDSTRFLIQTFPNLNLSLSLFFSPPFLFLPLFRRKLKTSCHNWMNHKEGSNTGGRSQSSRKHWSHSVSSSSHSSWSQRHSDCTSWNGTSPFGTSWDISWVEFMTHSLLRLKMFRTTRWHFPFFPELLLSDFFLSKFLSLSDFFYLSISVSYFLLLPNFFPSLQSFLMKISVIESSPQKKS